MLPWTGVAIMILAVLSCSTGAGALQDPPKSKEQQASEAENHLHYPFITDAEGRLIQDYYRLGSGHLPPGVAKKGEVPPALAKQLHLGGTIPAGMEKKLDQLPEDLDHKLIPVPAGYLRRVCGMTILLILEKNLLVVDALEILRQ